MNLTEFLLSEIDKDEVESAERNRLVMLGLARAWDEGRTAGIAGDDHNPYAE